MTESFNIIETSGIVLGIIAFGCFVMVMCGAIIRVALDIRNWMFS